MGRKANLTGLIKSPQAEPYDPEFVIPASKAKINGKGSWSAVIKQVTNMTATEAAEYYGEACRGLAKFGTKTLRELMVMRMVYDFIVNAPSPAMFTAIADREEGKVPQQVTGQMNINVRDWRSLAEEMGVTEEEVAAEAKEILEQINIADSVEGEYTEYAKK